MKSGSRQLRGRSSFPLLWVVSITLLNGCQPAPEYQSRTIPEAVHPVLVDADMGVRFGARKAESQSSPSPELIYNLPEGWIELPVTSMRRMNLRIAGDPRTECYLTVFQGGGSLRDNIDRWCQQMGRDPLPDEELAALPKAKLVESISNRQT